MTPELKSLITILLRHYPSTNVAIVEKAYNFAREAHKDQLRKNGEPYMSHVYETGMQLAKWKMPPTIVAAGLLHDVPEDTSCSIEDIKKEFGKSIGDIVEGETKLSKLRYSGKERYAENLRKMFFAIAQDVRVVVVKFADRIHNLKTLNTLKPEKQYRIAHETLEIYAPIANRLGMGTIRGDLEDLAFKYVNPKEYEWVFGLEAERAHQKEEYLDNIIKILHTEVEKIGIKSVSMHGRVKRLYSLYKKLLEKGRDINKVYDLVALRVIVSSIPECYTVLGAVHQRWAPLRGRIKDYIAQPKPNGYQSLHTTVFAEDGEIIELQIRTQEMHEEAEYGIAAHWFYSENSKQSRKVDHHVRWLKELAEIQRNIQDRDKFLKNLESLKIDFFKNRIFVFTPKGDVIDLPESGTPVDFAYAIHTEIGNHCTQTTINEQIAPLSTSLNSGDVVNIITDKKRKGPSSDWLKFVKTSHARSKIREGSKKIKLSGWMQELIKKKK